MCRASGSTTYLYPEQDLQTALNVTLQPYTYNGTTIVCPSVEIMRNLYYDIFYTTTQSNPDPNNPNAGG